MEKWDLFDEARQPLNKTHNRQDKMIKLGTIALPVAERLAPLRKVFEDFLFAR